MRGARGDTPSVNHHWASATLWWADCLDTPGLPSLEGRIIHAVVDRTSTPEARDRVGRGEGNLCARV